MYGRLLYSKTERFEKLGVLLVGLLEVSLSDDMSSIQRVLISHNRVSRHTPCKRIPIGIDIFSRDGLNRLFAYLVCAHPPQKPY